MKRIDEITRASIKQTLMIIVSLIPLFAFWFISFGHSLLRLRIGLYTGTILLVLMALARLTRGTLLWASAIFFGFALVFAAWLENMWVIRHLGPFPSSIFFVAMMLSMIMGRPFVEDYARKGLSPEQQESAPFVRTCFAMTGFWAAILLVLALMSLVQLFLRVPGPLDYLLIQLGVLLAAMAYQTIDVVHVKRRRLVMESASGATAAPTGTIQVSARGLGSPHSAQHLEAGERQRAG